MRRKHRAKTKLTAKKRLGIKTPIKLAIARKMLRSTNLKSIANPNTINKVYKTSMNSIKRHPKSVGLVAFGAGVLSGILYTKLRS
jgi:hypothetical protein